MGSPAPEGKFIPGFGGSKVGQGLGSGQVAEDGYSTWKQQVYGAMGLVYSSVPLLDSSLIPAQPVFLANPPPAMPKPKPEPEMVLQPAGRSIDLGVGSENIDLDGYAGPELKKESGA